MAGPSVLAECLDQLLLVVVRGDKVPNHVDEGALALVMEDGGAFTSKVLEHPLGPGIVGGRIEQSRTPLVEVLEGIDGLEEWETEQPEQMSQLAVYDGLVAWRCALGFTDLDEKPLEMPGIVGRHHQADKWPREILPSREQEADVELEPVGRCRRVLGEQRYDANLEGLRKPFEHSH